MRAVAIAVDEVKAVGNAVQPGDHVDLIATFQDPRTRQIITKMILQNVLVLFVDQGRADANGQKGASTSISLEVKPEQTELVKAAERSGTLAVTLRPVNESAVISSEGVSERELGGGQAIPETSPQPERTPVVIMPPTAATRARPEITIIKGSEEKTIAQ